MPEPGTIPIEEIDESEVLDILSSLVDKSLVIYEEDAPNHGRFRLSETLREYARERLEKSGETNRLHRLHHACFLAFAEEAETHLIGAGQAEWLGRLETEHEKWR